MCCTFLPHFGTHRGSRFFYFSGFFSELLRRSPRGHMHVTVHCRRSFVGHKRFLSDGPIWSFVCFAPNRQLQRWRERGESLTMKVSNQCSSCSILCAATGSSRRKWPSGFKSIHLRMFFTAAFGSLQINITAFRAQSNHNPSADGFV